MTIAVCLSLIAGSTFAYFTSNAETNITVNSAKVNVTAEIKQDSLKLSSLNVEQKDDQGNYVNTFENGGTATWSSEGELELKLMAPGDKAQFTIDVTNNSNIAIKYQVAMVISYDKTAINADRSAALAEQLVVKAYINGKNYTITDLDSLTDANGTEISYIDAIPGDTIGDIAVSVEFKNMDNEINNKAQDGAVSISFALVAIQGNGDVTTLETTTTEETTSNN